MNPEELLRRVRRMRQWADAIARHLAGTDLEGLSEDVVRELDDLERDLLSEVAA